MKTKADILDTENPCPSSSSRLGRSTLHTRNEQAGGGGLDRLGRGGPALEDGLGDDGFSSLSDKQWTAISCLLEGHTMRATADTCEIDVRTLRGENNSTNVTEVGSHSLTAGTLARPDWASKTAWDRMFRQEDVRTRSA